jgi:hypothetical protein
VVRVVVEGGGCSLLWWWKMRKRVSYGGGDVCYVREEKKEGRKKICFVTFLVNFVKSVIMIGVLKIDQL